MYHVDANSPAGAVMVPASHVIYRGLPPYLSTKESVQLFGVTGVVEVVGIGVKVTVVLVVGAIHVPGASQEKPSPWP